MAIEIRVSNLLPLISFATRAGSATQSDLTALQAEVDALEAQVAAKADKIVTITGSTLATGGGSLAANRVIDVAKATGAETATGTLDTKAITPFGLKVPLDAIRNVTITGGTLATGGGNLTANRVIDVAKASQSETADLAIDTKATTPFSLALLMGTISAALDELDERLDILYDIVARTQPQALIIISHGQSLSRRQPPRVTTGVTIPNYFQPVGGTDTEDFPNFTGNTDHLQKLDNFETFIPFSETASGESWGSGLGYQFRRNPDIGPMIFFGAGDGGRHWRELRPGTGLWGNLVSYVYSAYEYFRASGELNIKVRLFWTQGEADADTVAPGGGTSEAIITAAETQATLEQLLHWYRHDMGICFGKDMSQLPIYVTPLNSAHYDDVLLASPHPKAGAASRKFQQGQLQACKANPKLILLPPHYQFYLAMNGDGVHLTGPGRRYHAELCARVAERIEAGSPYTAPHVLSASRAGAVITADCYFPGGEGGVRDTTTFADPGPTHWPDQKYGVQFWSNAAAAFVNVSDVTIAGSIMTVTLASTPSGAGELRIAQLPWTTTATAATDWTARSNFRDAVLNAVAEDGTVLYHYMMPQTVSVA